MPNKKDDAGPITITEIRMEELGLHLVGTQPLILNAMSAKAKRSLPSQAGPAMLRSVQVR